MKRFLTCLFFAFTVSLSASEVIILIGPPGSGKGTVGNRYGKEHSIPHVSTGSLIRRLLADDSSDPKRRAWKETLRKGELLSAQDICEIMKTELSESDFSETYILDGFPRNSEQAALLPGLLRPQQQLRVMVLDVPDSAIEARLSGRLSCKNCEANFHSTFSPPQTAGVCDACDSPLVKRTDDKLEIIRNRLQVYHQETAPIIAELGKIAKVTRINGNGTPDEVYRRFSETL